MLPAPVFPNSGVLAPVVEPGLPNRLLPLDCPPLAPPVEDEKLMVGVENRLPEEAADVVVGCPVVPKLNPAPDISKGREEFM